MENRKEPVKSKALAIIQKLPGLAVQPHKTRPPALSLGVSKDTDNALPPSQALAQISGQTDPPLPNYKSWEWENAQNEKPVKILSYMGSLPNQFGNEGDFYVDETTNMLYGPKRNGVWPENGVLAAGLCKRTWVAFTRMRVPSKTPERTFATRLKSLFRFLQPIRSLFRSRRQKSVA